jgi:hypothetical protein
MKPYMSFKQRESYRAGLASGNLAFLELMLRQLLKLWFRLVTRRFCKHRNPVIVEFKGIWYMSGDKHVFCNECGRFLGPGIGRTILKINPDEYAIEHIEMESLYGVPRRVTIKKGCSIGKSESNAKGTDPAELL